MEDLYIKNKDRYLILVDNVQCGGNKYEENKLIKIIVSDLKQIEKDVFNRRSNKYSARQLKKNKESKKNIKRMTRATTLPFYEYKLDDIILSGKYLTKYNDFIKNGPHNKRILDSGYFEYQFKLYQHLNKCGINRTTQFYGTCWLNTLFNIIIFGDRLRGRFMQLLNIYRSEHNDFIDSIETTNKNKYQLSTEIEKDHYKIFYHFISILYKILCDEGLRNKNPKDYTNLSLTNLAISIKSIPELPNFNRDRKYYNTPTEVLADLAYNTNLALDIIINIFNKHITSNTNNHVTKHNNMHKTIYSYSNPEHVNIMQIFFYDENLNIAVGPSRYYDDVLFDNVEMMMNYEGSYLKFSTHVKNETQYDNICHVHDITNVDFLFVELYAARHKIKEVPKEINCYVDNKKTVFRLESAVIQFIYTQREETSSHIISGLICANEYYIYNSAINAYFKIDWRHLDIDNFKSYFSYAKVYADINVTELWSPAAIYYNTSCNFTYDSNECQPRRPSDK